jgi:Uncharacterized conserved protein
MQTSFTFKHNLTVENHFAAEIEIGLLSQSAYISPKFLYDALGSQLFTAITLLPEYYPTNIEQNIFKRYRDQIAKVAGVGGTLIDLGAGNCKKAESFFDSLQPKHYLAIDFSAEHLQDAVNKLKGNILIFLCNALPRIFLNNSSFPIPLPAQKELFFIQALA